MVNDEAVAYRPEAVSEHEGVWQEQEDAYPQERGEGNARFVGARVHESCQFSGISVGKQEIAIPAATSLTDGCDPSLRSG